MDGKVTYFYLPVPDLAAARDFYRDQLGLEEAWREGEEYCAFMLPGTDVRLMIGDSTADPDSKAGLVFTIPSVDSYYQERQQQIQFSGEPISLPGSGRWAAAQDASGNGLYFADVE